MSTKLTERDAKRIVLGAVAFAAVAYIASLVWPESADEPPASLAPGPGHCVGETLNDILDDVIHTAEAVRAQVARDCLPEGRAIISVEGLPDVSGTYDSMDLDVSVTGWTRDERAPAAAAGRCFVDDDDIFLTSFIHTTESTVTQIDVGHTGEGGDFAAVVRSDKGIDLQSGKVTHNYNPGQPGTVKATFPVLDEENWTGIALFKSTAIAETYNNREYSPWTDSDPRFAPNYDFTITLMCT